MSTKTPTVPLADKSSLLIALIADVLVQCASYQMSEEFAAFLRDDAELLAALQRLAFLVVSKEGIRDE